MSACAGARGRRRSASGAAPPRTARRRAWPDARPASTATSASAGRPACRGGRARPRRPGRAARASSSADARPDSQGPATRTPAHHEGDGLTGIVTAPFLHAGFGHLIGNTVPFVVMGVLIALNGAARVLAVTAIVGLVSGLGVWLIAPEH